MTKLLVLDKDGTLVRPKSGNTFVQHPEDQGLIEGVTEAIARYIADGWTIAIASNQGGCEVRSVEAKDIPIGSYYLHPPLMNPRKITHKEVSESGTTLIWEDTDERKHNWIFVHNGVKRKFQHKTVDMAIAEMQFAMKLIGLEDSALFCPDMEGKQCWHVHTTNEGESRHIAHPLHTNKNCEQLLGLFRKPNGGMLSHLKAHYSTTWSENHFLMIGDREEDRLAAQAAGFEFVWAHEWIALNS